ncbi:mitochondrial ribosomal protein MRP51 [Xylariomycetidae sp. FL0641]|nr:mitochondrial ribosomal protein MRP51 [Xylariomycetidae sp. FL0641]
MAGRSVSPGAALLRSSRMFSMPAPIPPPPGDYSTATKHHSPTATIHYPTHLTVTTPASSRVNGDWGFKRPFPLRTTTKTTYPLARVRKVDSIEQVTDFQSSSDHTITLQKFQEMQLPLSVPVEHPSSREDKKFSPKSVFEEDGDITALDSEKAIELENQRWRFEGPWLAGMTDGQFTKYIERTVRTRRPEFRAYLKDILAKQMSQEQEENAIADGTAAPPPVTAEAVTEAHLVDYLRELRDDRMQLYQLVSRFLDLAPVSGGTKETMLGKMRPNQQTDLTRPSPYGATGPPITHPSAGLSYLRTRSFQENHHLYGPQARHAPVKARLLMPRAPRMGAFNPVIGVGGIVALTDDADSTFNANSFRQNKNRSLARKMEQLELEKPGGTTLWVETREASVDSRGRVQLSITDPPPMAELIQRESRGEEGALVYEEALETTKIPEPRRIFRGERRQGQTRSPWMGSSATYGLGRE